MNSCIKVSLDITIRVKVRGSFINFITTSFRKGKCQKLQKKYETFPQESTFLSLLIRGIKNKGVEIMLIYRVTFILLERAFIVADNSNH